jgi:hypothetical protein
MRGRFWIIAALMAGLAGCDIKNIRELEEGVSTEADVRQRFGEPAVVYPEAGGAKTLEYPRQPEGQRNYMITIGADGKMSALRQVLTPVNFAKVQPGMDKAQVRRLLGLPGKTHFYELKREEVWDWRWNDGAVNKVFSATFGEDGRLTGSASVDDPRDMMTGGK